MHGFSSQFWTCNLNWCMDSCEDMQVPCAHGACKQRTGSRKGGAYVRTLRFLEIVLSAVILQEYCRDDGTCF